MQFDYFFSNGSKKTTEFLIYYAHFNLIQPMIPYLPGNEHIFPEGTFEDDFPIPMVGPM